MGETKEDYFNDLIRAEFKILKVTSLVDFLNAIIAINQLYPKVFYRGQADKEWEIESSAYRRLNKPTQKQLKEYHARLIMDVKHLNDGEVFEGLRTLAHLQHNGAKTILLDYSMNPLVSLWMSCIEKNDVDGAVYCFNDRKSISYIPEQDVQSEVDSIFSKTEISVFDPPQINRRITSQQSVFLISPIGKIEKDKHISIIIPRDSKKQIIEDLALFGISKKTVFPDFFGFIEWFDFDSESTTGKINFLIDEAAKNMLIYKYDKALGLLKQALALCEEEQNSLTALVYNGLGELFRKQCDYENALDSFNNVLRIHENVLGENHPDIAIICNSIANIYESQVNSEKALEFYYRALAIQKEAIGEAHPSNAKTYTGIASVFRKKGNTANALKFYKLALATQKEILGKDHLDLVSSYNDLAYVYSWVGNNEKALTCYKLALTIREKVLGEYHLDLASSYNDLADVYIADQNYDKAFEFYNKVLVIQEKVLGNEHPDTGKTYSNIGRIYNRQSNYCKAVEFYNKVVVAQEKISGINPNIGIIYDELAFACKAQGDSDQALEAYVKSYKNKVFIFGYSHSKVVNVLSDLRAYYLSIKKDETFDTWFSRRIS